VIPGILYISYDGMLEPLGQSQVLAYLERLSPGRRIHLISFEKRSDWRDRTRREAVRQRLDKAGIRWHPLRYHKRPSTPATAFDIAVGAALAVGLALRHRLSIVHARSYVAGVMALAAKRASGAAFLFDMRGFWADERVDGQLWPAAGRLYRAAKAMERRLLLAADHVVVLTQAAADELRRFRYLAARMPPISVIPTCADLDRFTIQGPPRRDPFVLGYVGSIGTWYLLDEMLRCFVLLREIRPGARLLIANRDAHDAIRAAIAGHGIAADEVETLSCDPAGMPAVIARMSAGMMLIKPAFSKIASAPTKLAEYLGCGVPCLGNVNVGDVEAVLAGRRVGVALTGFSEAELRSGIEQLVALVDEPATAQRCRETAEEFFSRDRGARSYAAIYDVLASGARRCE
jgi:glycosyltransferase involved in cell wall biosynthesis